MRSLAIWLLLLSGCQTASSRGGLTEVPIVIEQNDVELFTSFFQKEHAKLSYQLQADEWLLNEHLNYSLLAPSTVLVLRRRIRLIRAMLAALQK